MREPAYQQCIHPDCGCTFGIDEIIFTCSACSSLLDVTFDWDACTPPKSLSFFDSRRAASGWTPRDRADQSGVWRFRELVPIAPADELVTVGEGRTILQRSDELAGHVGMAPGHLFLQYEGLNPSGSFKDNGMAAAFTIARRLDRARVACASTGNTSASMAMFAGQTRTRSGRPMQAVVFVGDAKISLGKLSQALDYGAITLQVSGDFDACMSLVREAAARLNLYLMNSVNPFRLEGQKAIMYRMLEDLNWEVPDWIVVPGGNLGNSSAFGKAFIELRHLGLINRFPRLAIINAQGANTLYELFNNNGVRFAGGKFSAKSIADYYAKMTTDGRSAKTIASAIEIGRPVNLPKALRSLEAMNGVVEQVNDEEILDGKALVGRYGFGCEPASGASIAGLRQLIRRQVISRTDRVVCILTGHGLKDPDATFGYHCDQSDKGRVSAKFANRPIRVAANVEAIERAIGKTS